MFALKALLVNALVASSALAHFTLDYPTSRGFDDDNEPQYCGGFPSVASPRQPFPLGQGPIHIDSHHALATVVAFISTSSDPTSFDDFNKTSNGTSIPLASSIFQVKQGEACFNVDLGNLGVGLTNGSEVTLQVQYDGGDGNLYQCTDLILIEGYSVPSNETCTNDASLSGASSSSTASSGSGSSSAAATSAASSSAPSSSSSSSSGSSSGAQGMFSKNIVEMALMGVLAGIAGLALL
ncbi:uncharacterized protein I303_101070 [Kwoniella dejecticola CBS 10117]|uniref:Copper acquisition factor BIM1-like domain-containing protein n=1 Tax=Kwoniella dejecticola CBS 10117 TaxID=1296121 RepID=A0A1A6AGW3_9TREE|nr:uncharacterized protein I303_01073 [Kwoniella dejecticola CBS 10117]OBR89248.1 hypothetical protein I303_01073 [Kwoniella dejecticola CBS 10117]